MKTTEIPVEGRTQVDVALENSTKQLEDVVIVGFGTQKKESVVGAITTINPKQLAIPGTARLTQTFAGRLAGVISVQRSGEPGKDAADFWIRGISTFGSTTPLVYMDGVEISVGDLNNIDPANIESFSILKDASATAVYGARGANGVFLIESKKGADFGGKPKISVLVENSFSSLTKLPEFTDGVTFMELYNEATINTNPMAPLPYSADKIAGTREGRDPYAYPNADWYGTLFKDAAINQHVNFNARGGGKFVTYYMGASYYHDEGILKTPKVHDFNNNINNQRYNFVNNLSAQLTPSTELSLNLTADLTDYNGPINDAPAIFSMVMNTNPVSFAPFYPAPASDTEPDHIYFGNMGGGREVGNVYPNPYAYMVSGYRQSFTSMLRATFRVKQKFDFVTKGLSADALVSFKNYSANTISRGYSPFFYEMQNPVFNGSTGQYDYGLKLLNTENASTAMSQGGSTDGDRYYNLQFILNYSRLFGKHNVGGMLVFQRRDFNVNLRSSDGSVRSMAAVLPERNQGLSGRASYDYDSRYMIEFNFGYTGSERFAEGHRYGFFPSVGVGYNISNESFFEPLSDIISSLKVRGSIGKVGNDQIVDASGNKLKFPYLGEVSLNASNGFTFGRNQTNSRSGVSIVKYENNDISWSVTQKTNIGMDLGLFNRLTLNVDFFSDKTTDIVQQRSTVPATVGVGSQQPYANIGKVDNKGVDINMVYYQTITTDLIVSLRGTFTYARNKVVYRDEPEYTNKNLSSIGLAVGQPKALLAERLFIDNADIANSPGQTFMTGYQPGDIKYTDSSAPYDEAGVTSQIDANDVVPLGYTRNPEITYGFGFNLMYKKIDIGAFFQGVSHTSFFMNNIDPFGLNKRNVLQSIVDDRWTSENQNIHAFYPRLSDTQNVNNVQSSSWWLRDGSFLRLKNAEIGYTPLKWVRVYVSGTNLLTFTKFKLWDPEVSDGNGLKYPPLRVWNIGFQLNFN